MAKEDVVSHCNMPLYVVHDINHNTKKDPVGFLATKAFLCFPFIWLQEIDFIQPPCPPLNTIDRFNQLLIRQEEIGYKGGTFKKNDSTALGNALISHQGINTTSLSYFTVKQFMNIF